MMIVDFEHVVMIAGNREILCQSVACETLNEAETKALYYRAALPESYSYIDRHMRVNGTPINR